jgi:HD-GYP domain-containing protein (c-di-GMP phosphodiesterase class II)
MEFKHKDPLVELQLNQKKSAVEISAEILALGNQLVRTCVEQGGAIQAWFSRVDGKQDVHWIASWPADSLPSHFSSQALKSVVTLGKKFIFHDHTELVSGGIFPVKKDGSVVCLLALVSDQTDYFSESTVAWIQALTETISYNIFQLEYQTKKVHVEFSINRILQSRLNFRDTFQAIFDVLSDIVEADAAIALKYNSISRQFSLLGTHGFGARTIAKVHMYIENGLQKRFVSESQSIQIENIPISDSGEGFNDLFSREGFQAYVTIPLINRRELLGVFEVFWREIQYADSWKLDILQTVGESIAFAMEHTTIVEELKRRNEELTSTYTSTIEGLSRALELRDLETEGHTRRVGELTIRLAEQMQIPPDQRASIQQGALLHDIGKLGIPDAILLKPGSLTPQEWKVMQQHPLYAYNILASILTLRQALVIPLYHHERWDGSGYPYGLKGEQIPLSARLFAVVDVYDALTSDRPYRSAWSRSEALDYLREQAGKLFDPQVVTHFLELANSESMINK